MNNHKEKKRFYYRMLFNTLLLLIAVLGSFFAFYKGYYYSLSIVDESIARQKDTNIRDLNLVIDSSTTAKQIARKLSDHNFITNRGWFLVQAKLEKLNSNLKPGTYSISSNMSNSDILKLLTETQKTEEVLKFTIPEGFTIPQIAERLEKQKIVSKQDFLKAVNERTYDYKFLKNISKNSKYTLEGYLFPDTYEVRKGVTPEEIIVMMLNRFNQIMGQYSAYLHENNYSLHDIVTIASIIQEEAKLSEEKTVISGVIYNRLNANMKLQMCSTVQYALEKRKTSLSYNDLNIDSLYNTYKYEGIPIGPICSPGEESLRAALHPEANDYYYFVLKDSKSGAHAFSTTPADHQRSKVKYKQSIDKNFYE